LPPTQILSAFSTESWLIKLIFNSYYKISYRCILSIGIYKVLLENFKKLLIYIFIVAGLI